MKKIVTAAISTILLAASASCSDSTSGPAMEDPPLPEGMAVSDPVTARGVSASAGFSAASDEAVAYISASPGTFPDARSGTLSNSASTGSSVAVRIVEGGFDPVAIPAKAGDELRLVLTSLSGAAIAPVAIKVPPRRPPKVVRTSPSKGRTDVAFNVQVEVIFSEPINPLTVTSSKLSLTQGRVAVPATLELAQDGFTLKVVPDSPLDPGLEYILVSNGIQDLDGDVLAEPIVTSFATAPDSGGSTSPNKTPIASFMILPQMWFAAAINENGVVLGYRSGGGAILWSESGNVPNLDGAPFTGTAVNDAMVIAGIGPASETYAGQKFASAHAVQWKDGTLTDLGTLPGHTYSNAMGMNAAGDVIGTSSIATDDADGCCLDPRAVIWHDGKISELPFTWAYSINSRGEILGGTFVGDSWKVLIWRDGTSTILTGGCFDSPAGVSAILNDSGQVAGTCMNKPFIWKNGEVTPLPMPDDCLGAGVRDIDDHGRVVGYVLCSTSPTQRAAVWMNGSVFMLPAPSGESSAQAINNRGQIIGTVDRAAVRWVLPPTQ